VTLEAKVALESVREMAVRVWIWAARRAESVGVPTVPVPPTMAILRP
jgi:hypothetical protein